MFEKDNQVIEFEGKRIELEPKPTTFSNIFSKRKKAVRADPKPVADITPSTQRQNPHILSGAIPNRDKPAEHKPEQKQAPQGAGPAVQQQQKPVYAAKPEIHVIRRRGTFFLYVESIEGKHKGLEAALREQGIRQNVHEFIQRMLIASIALAVILAITMTFLFFSVGLPVFNCIVFGLIIGVATYYVSFGEFINYPSRRAKSASKNIERDILSAARDMIISLRSGMPLFNAIVSISTGYADASKEFAKVVERVQLGLPLEDAIDQTAGETKSASFKRMMLQASTSIKAGADVIDALQSVIDQLAQERIIELRRYGQSLNAIAMFYMLFGIILPSMGIAVVVILTTFIAIITITSSTLIFVLIGSTFLQVIFLEMVINSRPVYAM